MDVDDGHSNKFQLSKLDGVSYGAWKFKVRLLQVHKGHRAVVNGTETGITKDAKTFSVIGLAVKDSQVVHMKGYVTSKNVWKKLSDLFENKGTANNMHLISKLMTSRMDDEDNAQELIEKLRRVVG